MILHYLKINFRNIRNEKFRYIITTLGIAVGMVVFGFVIFTIDSDANLQSTIAENKRLYTAGMDDEHFGKKNSWITNEYLNLYTDFPVLSTTGFISDQESALCSIEGNNDISFYPICGKANEYFFHQLNFKFLYGGVNENWNKQASVVITEEYANRIFGESNVVGRELDLIFSRAHIPETFVIVGVINKKQDSTIFSDIYYNKTSDEHEGTESLYSATALIVLDKNIDVKQLNKDIKERYKFTRTVYFNNDKQPTYVESYFTLIPYAKNKWKVYAQLFPILFIASLVLIVALFNLVALVISSMQVRIRQFTIHRIAGAGIYSFMIMFLLDLIPIILASTALSYFILELLAHYLFSLEEFQSFISEEAIRNLPAISSYPFKIAIISIILSIIISLALALRLKKLVLVHGIRGHLMKVSKNIGRNTLLLVILILTIFSINISLQLTLNKDLRNTDYHTTLSIEQSKAIFELSFRDGILRNHREEIVERILALPGVLQINTDFLGQVGSFWRNEFLTKSDDYAEFWELDDPTFKLKLAPGEAIVTKKHAESLAKDSTNSFEYKIVGVVDKIPYIRNDIEEVALIYKREVSDFSALLIKCEPEMAGKVKEAIYNIIYDYIPKAIDYKIKTLYDTVYNMQTGITFFKYLLYIISIICIIISLLGIYTAITTDTNQKRKEIAIRKINGATKRNIFIHLSKSYWILLSIAFVIAGIIARFVNTIMARNKGNLVLHEVILSKEQFILDIIILLITACLIFLVSYSKIKKTANENPADVIK